MSSLNSSSYYSQSFAQLFRFKNLFVGHFKHRYITNQYFLCTVDVCCICLSILLFPAHELISERFTCSNMRVWVNTEEKSQLSLNKISLTKNKSCFRNLATFSVIVFKCVSSASLALLISFFVPKRSLTDVLYLLSLYSSTFFKLFREYFKCNRCENCHEKEKKKTRKRERLGEKWKGREEQEKNNKENNIKSSCWHFFNTSINFALLAEHFQSWYFLF